MHRKNFTLLELLAVISILLILFSLLYPSFSRIRKETKRVACHSNVAQIGRAMVLEGMNFKNTWAPSSDSNWGSAVGHTWEDYLSDYLDFGLNQVEKDYNLLLTTGVAGITGNRMADLRGRMKVIDCPGDNFARKYTDTIKRSYSGNSGSVSGLFQEGHPGNGPMLMAATKRISFSGVTRPANTLLLGERGLMYRSGPWSPMPWFYAGEVDTAPSDGLERGSPDTHNAGSPGLHLKPGYRVWVQCDGSAVYGHYSELVLRQNRIQ